MQSETLSVRIGSEEEDSLDHTSFLLRSFRAGKHMVGALGLIGPKRMDYSGAIARLEYLAQQILTSNEDE